MLQQLNNEHGDADLIPMVWDSDGIYGDPRYSWYPGNGYVPWIIFGGMIEPTWDSYPAYEDAYYLTHAMESPLEIQMDMELVGNDLQVTAFFEVTADFDVLVPKVWFAITHYRQDSDADYVNAVEDYSGETNFELSEIGETGIYSHTFSFHDDWIIPHINAVAVVQSWTGTKHIVQGAQTSLIPNAAITGTVTDDFNGDPIEGAVISAIGYQTTSDEEGTYTLELYARTFDVFCDYPGYSTGVFEDVTVAVGETVNGIDFSMEEGLPVPAYLQANLTDVVTLDWQPPGSVPLEENFESGDWPPEGWAEYQLNQAGGWEQGGGYNSEFCAHHDDINGVSSEDWLVSPQVQVGGVMTFWEMNDWMANYYEYHGIWISTGSSDPEDGDFFEVQEYSAVAEDAWEQRTLDLSSYDEPFYLAFKYVGTYATDWYVDDILIAYPQARELLGYNVYEAADEEPLNGDTPVEETSYVVGNPPNGTYTYSVTAVYTSEESLPSNEVTVEWDSEGVDEVTPLTTRLHGNYPNPFNPDTRIDFSLAEPAQVTVEVFNLAGQLVTTLVDDFRQAGEYTVSWDGSNATSGLYFYRMQTTDYSVTRKMTIIK